MMEWKYESDCLDPTSIYVAYMADGVEYHVFWYSGDGSITIGFHPPGNASNEWRDGGYLTRDLRIGQRFRVGQVPKECQFATIEEAQAVCERHYKLLMLQ